MNRWFELIKTIYKLIYQFKIVEQEKKSYYNSDKHKNIEIIIENKLY